MGQLSEPPAAAVTQMKRYVHLRCHVCGHVLEVFRERAAGGPLLPVGPAGVKHRVSFDGDRIAYSCGHWTPAGSCRSKPVLVAAKLTPLIEQARAEGKSVLTSYLLT